MKRRLLLFAVPLALGIAAFAALKITAPAPERVARQERVHDLRVVAAPSLDVVPRTLGFGEVEPESTWRAVARVEGRVVSLAENLESGIRVEEGEVLVRLDRTPYELAIAKTTADISKTQAELAELAVRETNDEAALEIESESLELAEAELERLATLLESGTVSQSQADEARRVVLTQRQSVQTKTSNLALYPAQRATLEASLAALEATQRQNELELSYTDILAPFEGVLAEVEVEVGQFVGRGEAIFELYGADRAVIDAEMLYADSRKVLGPEAVRILSEAVLADRDPSDEILGLFETIVRMPGVGLEAEWESQAVGMREAVDSATRAFLLRVAVEDPLDQAIPGVRPPLLKGTFCTVELRGEVRTQRLVLPRASVEGGHVHVVDAENRLRRRPVEVEFEQGGFVVLTSGVEPGEIVVVSDVGTALEGALVNATQDDAILADLALQAAGTEPLR